MDGYPVVIVGAGPGGLTAAYELARNGVAPLVLEKGSCVGGLARTETYKGYRFDIGGHRFYTKIAEVQHLWEQLLGDQFIRVPRLSRIYYNGRFFNYPLALTNVLGNLGLTECLRILGSYVQARLRPLAEEETFEQWVINRFGDRLYRMFFQSYTEKVWGIPCREIRAEWAAQRIRGLSLMAALANAVFGAGGSKSLIHEFHYPRQGPGQMWERCRDEVETRGGQVALQTAVRSVRHDGSLINSAIVNHQGQRLEVAADQFISTMALGQLVLALDPPPPAAVSAAARGLKYRDFIIVVLIVDRADLFPDNWLYIHAPTVRVGRIQNFKNWSSAMVPDPSKTSLGMEYFCSRGDDLWRLDDAQLMELAKRELQALNLADATDVEDGCVIRQPMAYPVYDADYRGHVAVIQDYLAGFANLQTIGRNGMHRYNNQDHSMLCGLYAARNLLGACHDLWQVNTERSYYEEQRVEPRIGNDLTTQAVPK